MRARCLARPGNIVRHDKPLQRGCEALRRRVDREIGLIDAVQFFRTWMHMNERDARRWDA